MAGTRRTSSSAAPWVALVCLLGLAVEVYTLAFERTIRVETAGRRQVLLQDFGVGTPMAQTFTMTNNGLSGIRIRITAPLPTDLVFDWQVSEQRDADTSVALYGNRKHVQNLAAERAVDLTFPSVAHSMDKTYTLQLHVIDVRPSGAKSGAGGVEAPAVIAFADGGIPGGTLVVNGDRVPGTLALVTIALGDTVLGRLRLALSHVDGPLRRFWLPSAALLLYNILLAAFVVHFWPRAAQ